MITRKKLRPHAATDFLLRRRLRAALVLLLPLLVNAGGCTLNPATGERQLTLIGEEREIAMGLEADQQISQSMGLYADEKLQAYVEEVGLRLAAQSERPDLPWKFRIVDDAAVNAFALPGGFIYLTRGIMAYFNSEAEMAAVLGHEIGHVTGRHSVEQLSRQQLAGAGVGLAMVLSEDLRQFGDLAQSGLGLMFLKYGRDDERQADDLGLRYMVRGQYDPREMPKVFDTLARVSAAGGQSRLPSWLSSHPAPEERAERARAATEEALAQVSEPRVLRGRYLQNLDGILYGENPRQGYFRDNVFLHPDLAFQIEFPRGWKTLNQPSQVAGVSPEQDAIVMLSLAPGETALAAAQAFFAQQGVRADRPRSLKLAGLEAATGRFTATRQQGGDIAGVATFVDHGGRVFGLVGYTGSGTWRDYEKVLTQASQSFRRVTDSEVLGVQPGRIDIVKIPRQMSIREFAERYRSSVPADTTALINQLEPDERIPAGTEVKRVLGGAPPK